jgi:hypothetical protein
MTIAIIGAVAVGMILIAALGRLAGVFGAISLLQGVATAIVLIVITPPLVLGAYTILRDDEKEVFRGRELYLRAGGCALGYVVLWGFFFLLVVGGGQTDAPLWLWFVMIPPFFVVGPLISTAALDLDPGNAFSHYAFYVLVTVLLGVIAARADVWLPPPA